VATIASAYPTQFENTADAQQLWGAVVASVTGRIDESAAGVLHSCLALGVNESGMTVALPAGLAEAPFDDRQLRIIDRELLMTVHIPVQLSFVPYEVAAAAGLDQINPQDPAMMQVPTAKPVLGTSRKERQRRMVPPSREGGRERTWAPGSAAVLDTMLRPGGPPVSRDAALVYLTLFSYMGADFLSRPSIPTIAVGARLCERVVRYKLGELEAIGLIERRQLSGRSVIYRLLPPWSIDPASDAGSDDTEDGGTTMHGMQGDGTAEGLPHCTTLHVVHGGEQGKQAQSDTTLHPVHGQNLSESDDDFLTLHRVQGESELQTNDGKPTLHGVHGTLHGMQGDPAPHAAQVTQWSNPMKKHNDNDREENAENDDEITMTAEIEHYLSGRTRSMIASATDLAEIRRWVRSTNWDLETIRAGIDAGLATFQKEHPGDLPRGARYYGGYVDKAWDRQRAKGVSGSERRAGGPGTGPGPAGGETEAPGSERGRNEAGRHGRGGRGPRRELGYTALSE
jgi:hypothetical protein